MARRKRSTNRRTAKTKGRRSSQAKKEARLVNNLVGLIVSLLMLLGLTNLGSLGTFIANCFRILVGESYPLAIITVMIFSLSYTFYAQAPRLKLRWVAGYLVTYTGLLLWLHVLMVSQQNVHANFIPVTWSNLSRVLFNGDNTVPIGGGMLGAYLYNGSDFLVSRVGTGILAWLLIVAGLVIFLPCRGGDFWHSPAGESSAWEWGCEWLVKVFGTTLTGQQSPRRSIRVSQLVSQRKRRRRSQLHKHRLPQQMKLRRLNRSNHNQHRRLPWLAANRRMSRHRAILLTPTCQ
ncbi:stage III sporulation protein E family protein [Limosilactobacillus oris F0423]|uniref:Stage III sporulation protein E family protein n=1 Tax=Limosilactobacillus oris F0423 TaxID=944562 RepID=A0ABN0D6E4_9LACO|nr:stage III sporulation protein E family protein [Limosilactobacillus oris F0423]